MSNGFTTTITQLTRSLAIPYCDEHDAGATLDYDASTQRTLKFKVRSYRFYKGFVSLNGIGSQ
jgi:hypothetical protein